VSTFPSPLIANGARAWAIWLVPAVVLATLVGWEIDWGRHVELMPAAPQAVEPKPLMAAVLPEYQIDGGLPAHSETVDRTLFNATRRPAPVLAGDNTPRRLKPGQFQLTGTAVSGERNIAFLKETGGKSRVVRQGDEIEGMRVALVAPDRVKLTLGDESEELVLKVAPGPKTTLAAAPPPPTAPGATPAGQAGAAARATRAQAAAAATSAAATAGQPQQNARAARRAARAAAAAGGEGNAPPEQSTDVMNQVRQRQQNSR
jgi:hypothetical protein